MKTLQKTPRGECSQNESLEHLKTEYFLKINGFSKAGGIKDDRIRRTNRRDREKRE